MGPQKLMTNVMGDKKIVVELSLPQIARGNHLLARNDARWTGMTESLQPSLAPGIDSAEILVVQFVGFRIHPRRYCCCSA
jgi:hypothetical protein